MRYHQISRVQHWSERSVPVIGDVRDLAVILCLDLQGLEFLVNELERHNFRDEFVVGLREALELAQRELETSDT